MAIHRVARSREVNPQRRRLEQSFNDLDSLGEFLQLFACEGVERERLDDNRLGGV